MCRRRTMQPRTGANAHVSQLRGYLGRRYSLEAEKQNRTAVRFGKINFHTPAVFQKLPAVAHKGIFMLLDFSTSDRPHIIQSGAEPDNGRRCDRSGLIGVRRLMSHAGFL